MNFKGLTAGLCLLFSAPHAGAELADVPSGCSSFDYRNLQPYYITSADQFGLSYFISPSPEDRKTGLGNVIFTLIDAYRNQYIHSANEVVNTDVLYTIHLLGEGQYCPVHIGQHWLEQDGQYALLDDNEFSKLKKLLEWRRNRERDPHEDPNIYRSVEHRIRAMLEQEWTPSVQDWYAEQSESTQKDNSATETPQQPEQTPVAEQSQHTASLVTAPVGQWRSEPDKTDKQSTAKVIYFPPPQTAGNNTPNKDTTIPAVHWVVRALLASLVLIMALLAFIMWKIFRTGGQDFQRLLSGEYMVPQWP